jgi:hypothetical protein
MSATCTPNKEGKHSSLIAKTRKISSLIAKQGKYLFSSSIDSKKQGK